MSSRPGIRHPWCGSRAGCGNCRKAAWDNRQSVDGLPLFGPSWDVPAEIPAAGGGQAQFVEGAVNSSQTPEQDLSVQLSGWMLMEAAHTVTA